ncbi:MAG: RagB/SusD family nutrient uptake outer membrane protein [Chitinophagaceae bacterium]|nr:RagB/SusD family nutrient uptake outer membrane protein [Chitinophagaceae bacterium]
MKLLYICLGLLLLVASGCKKSFLDRTHPGELTYDKFYRTEADFQGAVNACYLSLKPQVEALLVFNDCISDNTYEHPYNFTGDNFFFDEANVPSSSTNIKNFWGACYRSIALANMVISRLPDSEVPESSRGVFIAEAKFIRAYSYFNLVRVYGGVPKYDNIADINQVYETPRSSVEEIYDFIISDLISAQGIDASRSPAQAASAKGKATTVAVNALLGKVYLQKHDFPNATTVLGNIVNNSGLTLEEDLSKLYNADNPFNKEILLAINYERISGQSSPFTNLTLPRLSIGLLPNVAGTYGNGDFNIEPYILASFDQHDKRLNLVDSQDILVGQDMMRFYFTKKYQDLGTTAQGASGSDFIVLRYADVLLMYADALNQSDRTGDAYPYVNQVRNRAGLASLPSGYTKEQMNSALAQERQWEFLVEGDRWFDLSYRGFSYLKTTLNAFFPHSARTVGASIEDKERLFPLPDTEIAFKPELLNQNEGY